MLLIDAWSKPQSVLKGRHEGRYALKDWKTWLAAHSANYSLHLTSDGFSGRPCHCHGMHGCSVCSHVRVCVVTADEISLQIVTDVSPPKIFTVCSRIQVLRTSFSQNYPCSMVIPRPGWSRFIFLGTCFKVFRSMNTGVFLFLFTTSDRSEKTILKSKGKIAR